jgi:hypothetical protein
MATKKIKYIPMEDTLNIAEGFPPQWRVEALDTDTGGVYIAIFDGPGAQLRAVEYAAFKNGAMPAVVPGLEKPAASLRIKIKDGTETTLYFSGIYWTQDIKRRTVTAHEKRSIVPVDEESMDSLGA